jgi:hypothetical protein
MCQTTKNNQDYQKLSTNKDDVHSLHAEWSNHHYCLPLANPNKILKKIIDLVQTMRCCDKLNICTSHEKFEL